MEIKTNETWNTPRNPIPTFKVDPIVVLILSLLTCGLYLIYWNLKASEGSIGKSLLCGVHTNPQTPAGPLDAKAESIHSLFFPRNTFCSQELMFMKVVFTAPYRRCVKVKKVAVENTLFIREVHSSEGIPIL